MSITNKITFVVIAYVIWKCYDINRNPPLPILVENPWWGPGDPGKDDTSIKPFKINIPKSEVDDLKTRLSLPHRLTAPLENANFTYGFNTEVLKTISQYWQKKYDWKKREERLNRFPQFKTQIEGLDIHFIHLKPAVDVKANKLTVQPLLLIHGWPGSIVEFDEIIPLLTNPQEGSSVVFEVICPSLPGYGFSQASSKQGMGVLETSQIFLKLMKRLGFNKFYTQGGDWGGLIVGTMATLYPDNIIGMHSNMPMVSTPGTSFKLFLGSILPSGFIMRKSDELDLYPISKFLSYMLRESGYLHIQATKPDTIGVALGNSPIGLAAYILEKFSSWTHKENCFKPDGGLLSKDYPISLDRLLDNVSLYWFSRSITSSMRYYAESFVQTLATSKINEITTDVPAGFSVFAHELMICPENILSHKYRDIAFYRRHDKGGHFAAMEVPELLAKDVHEFVTEMERRKEMIERGEL